MRRAVCPGSFDPLHKGHVEVIARAANLFEEVVVAVSSNPAKTYRFSVDERIAMIETTLSSLAGVTVRPMGLGLLAEFCREIGADAIVKGLRGGPDLEFETPMAAMNRQMQAMHEKMAVATTPQERQALMAEHMKTMQDGMRMMESMHSQRAPGNSHAGMAGMPHGPQMMEKRMAMMESMMQMMMALRWP